MKWGVWEGQVTSPRRCKPLWSSAFKGSHQVIHCSWYRGYSKASRNLTWVWVVSKAQQFVSLNPKYLASPTKWHQLEISARDSTLKDKAYNSTQAPTYYNRTWSQWRYPITTWTQPIAIPMCFLEAIVRDRANRLTHWREWGKLIRIQMSFRSESWIIWYKLRRRCMGSVFTTEGMNSKNHWSI